MDRPTAGQDQLVVNPSFQADWTALRLTAADMFDDARVAPWRTLPGRQNCVLNAHLAGGRSVRWHVKRYAAHAGPRRSLLLAELNGHALLTGAGVPTFEIVALGQVADGRGFVVIQDLAGYTPADKLVQAGTPFEKLLIPTAHRAAQLHRAGLHHRDLYLCHFMARLEDHTEADIRLIDVARVQPLPRLTRRRWVVKDLAQFWYSTLPLGVTDEQRKRWLEEYARQAGARASALRPAIEWKVRLIARHDRRLRAAQPTRNISIPTRQA